MERFALETKVDGMTLDVFMAQMLEKNERQEIEIERGKLAVGILKQMNNRSRLLLDAAKFELKSREAEKETEKAVRLAKEAAA